MTARIVALTGVLSLLASPLAAQQAPAPHPGMMKPGMMKPGFPKPGMVNPGAGLPRPGMHLPRPGMGGHVGTMPRPGHWGGKVGGRWHAGMGAPGGWGAYRAPVRGWRLPRYWVNPSYYVVNFPSYGLYAPTAGYTWSRYYDDAVLIDNGGRIYDTRRGIDWDRYDGGYAGEADAGGYDAPEVGPDYGPSASYDPDAYRWDDSVTDGAAERGTYEGAWRGGYVDKRGEVYRGTWEGTYTDDQGRVYEGSYKGTAIGAPRRPGDLPGAGYAPPAADPAPAYDPSYGDGPRYAPAPPIRDERRIRAPRYDVSPQGYERCRADNGLGGAAIGGVIGGIAGNRIAGRGNRTLGTVIGGVGGAAIGAAIDKAENACRSYRPHGYAGRDYRGAYRPAPPAYAPPAPYPAPGYAYPPAYGYPQAYGWQGGYYYPQGETTTVVVTPGGSTTTTTVTEEITYETVRRPAPKKKRWVKPRAKPVCACR